MARALSRLLHLVGILYVFSNFINENDISHAHNEKGVVPNIHNAFFNK